MGATVDFTSANGLFKQVYSDEGYEKLVPENDIFAQDIPYVEKDSPGKSFIYPVQVGPAGGFAYGGANRDGVLTLSTAISARFENATVYPYLYGFKQQIGYQTFVQLGKIKNKDRLRKAFLDGTSTIVEPMKTGASFQREHQLMHGQSLLGIGVITGTVVSGSGTGTQVWTISNATWNLTLLSKCLNMRLDIYDTTGVTKRNSSGTVTLSSIDDTNKRVTLVGTSTELDAIVATDALHIEGSKSDAMVGLHSALSNATGTYLGLSATTYPLWSSNQFAFGGNRLSVGRLGQMVNKVVRRGQVGDLTLYANIQTITDIQESVGGQINLSNGPKSFENEVQSIICANRKVSLKAHDLCFPGYCYLVPSKGCLKRIGPEDLSFYDPTSGAYFQPIAGGLGAELKCWGLQSLVVKVPGHCCLGSGITNSTD